MVEAVVGTGYVSNVYMFRKAGTRGRGDVLSPVTPVPKMKPLSSGRDYITAVTSHTRDNTDLFQSAPLQRTSQDEKIINTYEEQEVAQYNLSNPYESVRMAAEGVLLSGLHFDQWV